MRSRTREAAHLIAAKGRAVLPCRHANDPEKPKAARFIRDILENGHLDATTDQRMVDAFWSRFPNASIGVRLEGIAVVDIESVAGHGVDGYQATRKLEADHGELPRTRTHGSASGGNTASTGYRRGWS